ncbi:MAG TPA: glycosyltransferase family 4 protein [Anaerolineales bacterium]|nr:glycosyltransferase family 4 protein [Anaerolineales bacterium]
MTALTYYRPHTSGLTIYAERLTRAFSERGHEVTVLTSQYEPGLPRYERVDGVQIVRFPVILRVSKGVISPTIGRIATRLVRENDVVILHLPQFDAAGIALRGKLFGKPTVITYHCDLSLPAGAFNRIVNQVVHLMNHLAASFSDRIVTYTQDYADHSPYLTRHRNKLVIIPPPVELPGASQEDVARFKARHNPQDNHPVIGMAARFATEKGVEVLLEALPIVGKAFPAVRVLFAGQYQDVLGEQDYYKRLLPRITSLQEQGGWEFLGILSPNEMASFYPNLDALVVPSLNSTEAFGLVQIEAMMNGVPCVAASLPGVRQPVEMTGMGEIFPIGDSRALAEALIKVFKDTKRYGGDPQAVARRFQPEVIAASYERLFAELQS